MENGRKYVMVLALLILLSFSRVNSSELSIIDPKVSHIIHPPNKEGSAKNNLRDVTLLQNTGLVQQDQYISNDQYSMITGNITEITEGDTEVLIGEESSFNFYIDFGNDSPFLISFLTTIYNVTDLIMFNNKLQQIDLSPVEVEEESKVYYHLGLRSGIYYFKLVREVPYNEDNPVTITLTRSSNYKPDIQVNQSISIAPHDTYQLEINSLQNHTLEVVFEGPREATLSFSLSDENYEDLELIFYDENNTSIPYITNNRFINGTNYLLVYLGEVNGTYYMDILHNFSFNFTILIGETDDLVYDFPTYFSILTDLLPGDKLNFQIEGGSIYGISNNSFTYLLKRDLPEKVVVGGMYSLINYFFFDYYGPNELRDLNILFPITINFTNGTEVSYYDFLNQNRGVSLTNRIIQFNSNNRYEEYGILPGVQFYQSVSLPTNLLNTYSVYTTNSFFEVTRLEALPTEISIDFNLDSGLYSWEFKQGSLETNEFLDSFLFEQGDILGLYLIDDISTIPINRFVFNIVDKIEFYLNDEIIEINTYQKYKLFFYLIHPMVLSFDMTTSINLIEFTHDRRTSYKPTFSTMNYFQLNQTHKEEANYDEILDEFHFNYITDRTTGVLDLLIIENDLFLAYQDFESNPSLPNGNGGSQPSENQTRDGMLFELDVQFWLFPVFLVTISSIKYGNRDLINKP